MTTTQQILAWVGGAIVFLSPLAYKVMQLLMVVVDEKRKAILRGDAKEAAYYVEEAACSGIAIDKAKMAHDMVAEKNPSASDDDIEIAIKAAVAAAPGLGLTGKKNGVN